MATTNRNRGYRDSNQQWNDSSEYGRDYQRDYNQHRRAYDSGSTYGSRGYGDWQSNYSESDNDNSGDYGRWQRRYGDEERDYNQQRMSGQQGYYGGQGSRYGESGSYGNRRRESDYENTGTSWGDAYSSNYGSSYREFPDYEDYERGSYGNSGSRYRNYGGDYGSMYGSGRYGSSNFGGSRRGQQQSYGQERYGGNYGSSYGKGYYGNSQYQPERGWWDKTTDEVSSWFGDEDAERRRDEDRRREGKHRGKGPKGYQRSDERIKDDINDRLSDDAFVDASNIDVTVTNGEVTLTGTVSERSAKRRAEDIAESVSGVKNVEVRLRVQDDYDYGNSSYRSGTTAGTSATDKIKNRQSSLTETK
jgi:osmotically-inducible protein OsmY